MPDCPKADPASFITWCIMRLEKSEHDREVWRCIKCGHTGIRPNPITDKARSGA